MGFSNKAKPIFRKSMQIIALTPVLAASGLCPCHDGLGRGNPENMAQIQ
jgi:hypothetical protein